MLLVCFSVQTASTSTWIRRTFILGVSDIPGDSDVDSSGDRMLALNDYSLARRLFLVFFLSLSRQGPAFPALRPPNWPWPGPLYQSQTQTYVLGVGAFLPSASSCATLLGWLACRWRGSYVVRSEDRGASHD